MNDRRPMRRIAAGVAVSTGIALAALPVEAATIRVPEDHPTIYEAIDAAVSGDSVSVGPGTWTDTDTRVVVINGIPNTITASGFLKGGVTVVGRDGRDATHVNASGGPGFVVTFIYANQGEPASLSGMA